MVKASLLVFFLVPLVSLSQYVYTPNTVYIIPPTSGCNGEWAVIDSAFASGLCNNPTYSTYPWGCATVNHRNGDTLFLDLCAIPCEFKELSADGSICMLCSIGLSTAGNTVTPLSIREHSIYPNPNDGNFRIEHLSSEDHTLYIRTISGQLVHQQLINNSSSSIAVNNLKKGVYLISMRNEQDEMILRTKIHIIE
jgi:hypothetical protein